MDDLFRKGDRTPQKILHIELASSLIITLVFLSYNDARMV